MFRALFRRASPAVVTAPGKASAIEPKPGAMNAENFGIINYKGVFQGNTIIQGLDRDSMIAAFEASSEPMHQSIKDLIETVARDKGLEYASLRAILAKMNENDVPDADIVNRLSTAADQLVDLRERLAAREGLGEIDAARHEILKLVDEGNLSAARDRARAQRDEIVQQRDREEAETWYQEGTLSFLMADYDATAAAFKKAAALFKSVDHRRYQLCLCYAANALEADYLLVRGDINRQREAVQLHKEALASTSLEDSPEAWAQLNQDLGVALMHLATREKGNSRHCAALVAFRRALGVYTFAAFPDNWFRTSINLLSCLISFAPEELDGTLLDEALEVSAQLVARKDMLTNKPLLLGLLLAGRATVLRAAARACGAKPDFDELLGLAHEAHKFAAEGDDEFMLGQLTQLHVDILQQKAEAEGNLANSVEAVRILRALLERLKVENVPKLAAELERRQGEILLSISKKIENADQKEVLINQAVEYAASALQRVDAEDDPDFLAHSKYTFGMALQGHCSLGKPLDVDPEYLVSAIFCFQDAMAIWEKIPERRQEFAGACLARGALILYLSAFLKERHWLNEAIDNLRTARNAFGEIDPQNAAVATSGLEFAEKKLKLRRRSKE